MQVEAEFEEVVIVETIPVHSQVLADPVFTGAFPGFDAKTPFLEDFVNF